MIILEGTANGFLMVGLPIICAAVAGIIVGAIGVLLIPFFKIKKAQKTANKILRDAEIKSEGNDACVKRSNPFSSA